MELVEITEKRTLTREEAAARLRELADQLARHNDLEFERDGMRLRARVPDEVEFELEFEIEDGRAELEIELGW